MGNKKTVSIDVEPETKIFLDQMRVKYGTYKAALRALIQNHLEDQANIMRLKKRINELEDESKEDKNAFREIALNNSKTPIMIPAQNPNMIQNVMLNPPGTLPPPPPKPKQLTSYKAPNTGDLKKDYQKEVKTIFTGEILKPSEIIETTQPKFKETPVEYIDSQLVPLLKTLKEKKE